MSILPSCSICSYAIQPTHRAVSQGERNCHQLCKNVIDAKNDVFLFTKIASIATLFASIKRKKALVRVITLGFLGGAIGNKISRTLPTLYECNNQNALFVIYLQFLADGMGAVKKASFEEAFFCLLRTSISLTNQCFHHSWGSYVGTLLGLRYGSRV